MRSKVAGTWKDTVPYARVAGGWTKAKEGLVKVDGVWKQFYLELSVALVSAVSVVISSYEYRKTVTLKLAGTYGGTVTAARVSGSSSMTVTKTSDTVWTFSLASAVGAQSAVYRFTYANALETSYVDVDITVSKTSPPPPPPPPPYVPPPYVPPPPGGGGGSGVIVDYPTYVKTFERYTWGVRNGPPNGWWWAEVSWNPNTGGPGSGRIPAAGQTLPLNSSGGTTYYDGLIPITGLHRIIWHFSDGQTVTKYIYVPYYWEDWVKEYGVSKAQALPYAYYYTTAAKICEVNGQARYGLKRGPDKGGLYWWVSQVIKRGYPWTMVDVETFSQAAMQSNNSDRQSTQDPNYPYRSGTWGGDFTDLLPTRY